MLKEALDKIQAEVAAKPKEKYVSVVGAFLQKHVQENPQHAELIAAEGKTIAGSLDAMKTEARKHQSGGVGVLTDDEAFEIVLKYFGVEVAKAEQVAAVPAIHASIDDLL